MENTTTATSSPFNDGSIVLEKRSSAASRVAKDTDPSDIRIVSPSEYKEAAKCLAEAFRNDHVVRYAIDTPDRMHWSEQDRFNLHKAAIEYVTYAHCLKGLVTTTGDDYGCVALWMPPGKNMDDLWTILRSGMWRLQFALSKEGRERFFKEFLPLLGATKREVLGARDKDSWYLNYIGTKPQSRGKGYAKKLITHITDRVSVDGRSLRKMLTRYRPIERKGHATWRALMMSTSLSMGRWDLS